MEEKFKQASEILIDVTAKVLETLRNVEQDTDHQSLIRTLDKIYKGKDDKSKLDAKVNQIVSLVKKYRGNLYEDSIDWLIILVNEGTELMPEMMFFDFMDYMVTKQSEVIEEHGLDRGLEVWKNSWIEYVKKSDVIEDSQILVKEMEKMFGDAVAKKQASQDDLHLIEGIKDPIVVTERTRILSKKIPIEFLIGIDWKEEKVKAKKDKGRAEITASYNGAYIRYVIDWGTKPEKVQEKFDDFYRNFVSAVGPIIIFDQKVHRHDAKSFIAFQDVEGISFYTGTTIYRCFMKDYWISIHYNVGSNSKETAEKVFRDALRFVTCH